MANYKKGDSGAAVRDIQAVLSGDGYYHGPIDGVFGGATDAAVRAFQDDNGITVDGIVGPVTWGALMVSNGAAALTNAVQTVPAAPPASPVPASPVPASPLPRAQTPASAPPAPPPPGGSLSERCLGLTGSFENSCPVPDSFAGLSGNFDGMGISFGALQQNFGQGSLQPLLLQMVAQHREVIARIFGSDFAELVDMLAEPDTSDQVEWAISKQTPKFNLIQPWKGYFVTLGRTREYIGIQSAAAATVYQRGLALCRKFGLVTERAAALMFDIVTQNGSISTSVSNQIFADFADPAKVPPGSTEQAKLVVVANRRAEAANPKWVEDVRVRKLTIANGEGVVHGLNYDLATGYGIRLVPAADLA